MATYYWVGGGGAWTGAYSSHLSTTTGKASFQGSRVSPSTVINYTNLVGTISIGDRIYANQGYIGLATSDATNPSGFFSTDTSTTVALSGMTIYNSASGYTLTSSDTVIVNQYSLYTTESIDIYFVSPSISIAALDMSLMRGEIKSSTTSTTTYLSVLTTLTFPPARTTAYLTTPAILGVSATTTINNNGVTAPTSFNQQGNVAIVCTGLTAIPTNIVAYSLYLNTSTSAVTNLGAATPVVVSFYNYLAPAYFNAGTSTITCSFFTGGGNTYNNVTFNQSFPGPNSIYDSNTYNIFSINPQPDGTPLSSSNSILFTSGTTTTANKFNFNFGSSPTATYSVMASDSTGFTAAITQTNNKFTYIQGLDTAVNIGLYGITFSPANTFFSVQQDYTASTLLNTNIRPSPSPMMMV